MRSLVSAGVVFLAASAVAAANDPPPVVPDPPPLAQRVSDLEQEVAELRAVLGLPPKVAPSSVVPLAPPVFQPVYQYRFAPAGPSFGTVGCANGQCGVMQAAPAFPRVQNLRQRIFGR